MADLNAYVTPHEAAHMLGVTYWSVIGYIRADKLPVIAIGRSYLIKRIDVQRFIRGKVGRPSK